MSQGNVCRLCVEICEDYKSLYDESANASEVHQLMSQYFDQKLFAENNFTVMCMKCWHQISDFNSFQHSVYRAQTNLHTKEEEIDIKSEEEFLSDDNISSSYNEQTDECNIVIKIDTMDASSNDDSSKMDDILEYYDPVSVASDGEFGNRDNSTDLLVVAETLSAECDEALAIHKKSTTASVPHRLRLKEKFAKASDELIAQWMPFLKCMLCADTCSTYSLLQHHFQDKHPLAKCQARCCGKNYSRRDTFEDHIRLHIDSNSHACTICGRQLKSRRSLAYHIREHHSTVMEATVNTAEDSNIASPSLEKVTEISKESGPKNVGRRNLRGTGYIKKTDDFIATIKPTLKCDLCPAECSTYSLLRQHFSLSHPEHQCYITCCQRKLTVRFRIVEHLQLHANPDAFKCELCDVRYSTHQKLQSHLRTLHATTSKEMANTGIRKKKAHETYHQSDRILAQWLPSTKCAVCKKAFATLTLLKSHFQQCHCDEQFRVECCRRKYYTRYEVIAHVQYHVEPTYFKCDLCCVAYSHERSLKKHMHKFHTGGV